MRSHYFIKRESRIPLVGVNVFGVIDRGTNLLQVRPVSGCPLNCIYCSVDEGPFSSKPNTYEVECDYLLEWFNKVVSYKKVNDVEAHIDGIGEPLMYKSITPLIKGLRGFKSVKTISMQSNGFLLNEDLINELSESGLDRINLSINTLKPGLAKELSGIKEYDINKIKEYAELISDSSIDLFITPILVPGFNESDLSDVIEFAKRLNAGLGIQKYEKYKHGRKNSVKEQSWFSFNKLLKGLEEEHGVKLLINKEDFNISKTKSFPIIFSKGERVNGKVVLPGWMSNEVIIECKNRLITVFHAGNYNIGDRVNARIVKNKHNLYLASKVMKS